MPSPVSDAVTSVAAKINLLTPISRCLYALPCCAWPGSATSYVQPCRRNLQSVWWQRLGNLLRLACIGEDLVADHAHRHLMKVGSQSLIKFGKLGPQDLVEKPLRRPDHDRVAPLPIIPVGLHAIASAQCKKQMPRPLIRHRE